MNANTAAADIPSRILCEIDFDREGRQSGYLQVPQSRNTAGWGIIETPIIVVKNGEGPTVLLTGGVHGSEYEGQIAVSELGRTLKPEEIQGRVIMIPTVNVPAVHSNTRITPLDQRDLNRSFPGDPYGTFSPMMAHFLDSTILPLVDVSVDIHSCGQAGDAALSTNMHHLRDPEKLKTTLAAAEAFAAPFNVVFGGVDETGTFTSSIERRGIISLGTEVGGWGRVNIEGLRITRRGIRNVLKHFGVIEGTPETAQRDGSAGARHMTSERKTYTFSPAIGTFEPCNLAGDKVREGDVAGYLHFVEDIDRDPIEFRYKADGILWMAAGPGRVARGDRLVALMRDYEFG